MDDIRINSVDSDYLVLETQDGQQFRLLNDEALTSAVRKVATGNQAETLITPREIQDAVRSGVTVDSLVSSSGATYEFVEKFAAPVLDELAHIIDSASAVRFSPDAKLDNESFGAMISAKLQAKSATDVTWTASRIDLGQWQVAVRFELNSGTETATWSFDSRHLVLVPLDESATALSRHSQTPAGFLTATVPAPAKSTDTTSAATVKLAVVTEPNPESTAREADSDDAIKDHTDSAPVLTQAHKAEQQETANLSATADLLQALREKRAKAQEEAMSLAAEETSLSADDTEKSGHDSGKLSDESADSSPVKPIEPKKGRAAMPSWDQIVFGTKTDE